MPGLPCTWSVAGGLPRTAGGDPQPWLTYAAVAWLGEVLTESTRVFEHGAGASTAWFDRRVRKVVAVEHSVRPGDRGWAPWDLVIDGTVCTACARVAPMPGES